MAINATIPATKPGLFPPQVIRREIVLHSAYRQKPHTPAWNRPAPKAPQANRVYSGGANIDVTV
ncbi:MAG: hypothetical protein ACYTGH_03865 [Planctomycetota bacterium]|jgi:hypothetical protein